MIEKYIIKLGTWYLESDKQECIVFTTHFSKARTYLSKELAQHVITNLGIYGTKINKFTEVELEDDK